MEFIGRESELAILEREYARDHGFVVIYGRRRIGKTRLVKEFVSGKNALYFLASQESEPMNLQRFARLVASFTGAGYLAEASFTDWRPLFNAFAAFDPETKKVLVIDELPYLAKTNPAFLSVLQSAWDEMLSQANVMLILCGSSVHMMRDQILSRESPLYGRRTSQLKLPPLPFHELEAHFVGTPFKRLVELYSVTGGVPKYLEFFEADSFREESDVDRAIAENVLRTTGFLHEEPYFLLGQDLSDPVNYLTLLTAIALGHHRLSDISRMVGKRASDLTGYLKILISLGYLERRVPFNEDKPERSKNGLYHITDPFLRFWLRYVQPFEGELEMGNLGPSNDAMMKTFRSNHVPFAFEDISRETFGRLCTQGQIPFSPKRIASYWNRSGSVEADVCAQATEGTSPARFVGECKYHATKAFSVRELQEVLAKLPSIPGSDQRTLVGLFSATGFEDALIEQSGSGRSLILIDKNRIVSDRRG
ncbi:ATP-binding protein [Curtanaerobium respiraculi]|uniref:ATP-binding protein n=1 Tax=Curtanaerobium respiraculi TaxID=2949669 RepID=UPI0024B345B9|nr:ATP-binding protein [Curtanaerobium respiraculi]